MKILVIEDELKLANALARGLKQENYAVEVCNNGDEGLSAALHGEYDLMIIDRMLPGKEGVQFTLKVWLKGER